MNNVLTLIVAATMLASGAFARDLGFEERFRAKYGRYTPAEEARRASQNAPNVDKNCDTPVMACCHRREHKQTAAVVNPWLAAKLGTAQSSAPQPKCEHGVQTESSRATDPWQRAKFGFAPAVSAEANAVTSMTCCD